MTCNNEENTQDKYLVKGNLRYKILQEGTTYYFVDSASNPLSPLYWQNSCLLWNKAYVLDQGEFDKIQGLHKPKKSGIGTFYAFYPLTMLLSKWIGDVMNYSIWLSQISNIIVSIMLTLSIIGFIKFKSNKWKKEIDSEYTGSKVKYIKVLPKTRGLKVVFIIKYSLMFMLIFILSIMLLYTTLFDVFNFIFIGTYIILLSALYILKYAYVLPHEYKLSTKEVNGC
nr:DUF443 family protein [Mammaliicoccus sp. Marseille-Q6498]